MSKVKEKRPCPVTPPPGLERRLAVIGIALDDRRASAGRVNMILAQFADIIVARTGVPMKDRGAGIISLILDANTNELGALTGKLGMVPHVRVRSVML